MQKISLESMAEIVKNAAAMQAVVDAQNRTTRNAHREMRKALLKRYKIEAKKVNEDHKVIPASVKKNTPAVLKYRGVRLTMKRFDPTRRGVSVYSAFYDKKIKRYQASARMFRGGARTSRTWFKDTKRPKFLATKDKPFKGQLFFRHPTKKNQKGKPAIIMAKMPSIPELMGSRYIRPKYKETIDRVFPTHFNKRYAHYLRRKSNVRLKKDGVQVGKSSGFLPLFNFGATT